MGASKHRLDTELRLNFPSHRYARKIWGKKRNCFVTIMLVKRERKKGGGEKKDGLGHQWGWSI